jgi:membrane-bound serine protease (ClpP class)
VPRAPPQAPANEPPASSAASSPGAAATPAPGPTTPPSNADARAAKRLNDAAAYIRSLAQLRSRNAAWAERAVRESVSLSAEEALAERVIDFVAADLLDLLRKLDGRTLRVGARDVTLATAAAAVIPHDPDWRGRLLAVISDPSVALVLMMLGVYGLLFEFMNPGFVAPGVIGGVCLLLALFALQLLPINYAGLALILLGIAFLVAEAFMPSFGVLGLGGVAAFAFGALMLIDSDVSGLGIPRALVAALTLVSAAAVFGIAAMAAKARRRPVVSGHLALAGATGEVVEVAVAGREGWARIHGEQWRVRSQADLVAGQRVRVTRADGLTLDVAPLDEGRSA